MTQVKEGMATFDHSQAGVTGSRATTLTLTQYIVKTTANDQALAVLMSSIQHACKVTANAIRKAGIGGMYGMANTNNATGDDVKVLDVISNDVWVQTLTNSGVCSVLVSEEEEDPIFVRIFRKQMFLLSRILF